AADDTAPPVPCWKDNPLFRWAVGRYHCRKTRLGIRTSVLYIATLVLFFGYALPTVIDQRKIVVGATRLIKSLIGSPVSARSYQLGFDGGPGLILTDAAITDRNGASAIEAERITLTFDLLRSLTRGPTFSTVTLIRPRITLVREADKTFNLPLADRLFGPEPTSSTGPLFPAGSMRIEQGTVSWTDRAVGPEPLRLQLEGVEATVTDFGAGGPSEFSLTFVHRSGARKSDIAINGSYGPDPDGVGASVVADIDIRRVPLDAYWPYLSRYLPFARLESAVTLKGKARADSAGAFASEGTLRLDDLSLLYPEAYSRGMNRRSLAVDYRVEAQGERLTLHQATMTDGPLALTLGGTVDGYRSDDPILDLSLDMAPVSVEALRSFAPDRFLTSVQAAFVRETMVAGTVSLSDVSYRGPLSLLGQIQAPEARSRFKGTLTVADATLQFSHLTYPFTGIGGLATFDGDRLTLDGIGGDYGHSAISEATGIVENLHEWPRYRVSFKADLDLSEAHQILASRVMSDAFRAQLLGVSEMSGTATLDLDVGGDTRDPVGSLSVSGDMRLADVTLRHDALGLIHHLNGRITGDRSLFKIDAMSWLSESSPCTMTGALRDVFKPVPTFELRIDATTHLADLDLIPFLAARHPLRRPGGFARIDMRLAGGFDRFSIDQRIDLADAAFEIPMVVAKREGKPLKAHFTGHARGDELEIGRIDLDVGGTRVAITGKIRNSERGAGFDLNVTSDRIMADDIDDLFAFMDDIDGAGTARGAISIRYAPGEALRLGGRIDVLQGRFKLPLFAAPFHETDGAFELAGSHVFLKDVNGKFGAARFTLDADAALSATLPLFTLNVRADGLDLYDFFGAPTWESSTAAAIPSPPTVAEPAQEGRNYFDAPWKIVLHSDTGHIGFLTYQNLDTTITYKDSVFHVSPLTFEGHGGYWMAPLTVTMDAGGDLLFRGRADIRDLAIERYLTEAAGSSQMIEGAFGLSGGYQARGYLFYDIMRSLSGEFSLSSGPGVIRRFAMLSKIFSLLNVSQYFRLKTPDLAVDGMPFENVTGGFVLEQGVARTENLRVESEAIRLVGKGGYDIATGDVDMVVTAAPFVTIDRIVSAIPVAGYVLAGDEESFLASSFTVKGALGDPAVLAIPFESLAKGTLGILKRFITLPVKAGELLDERSEPTRGPDHDDIN
ncbi:MAG: AsmA-like C-terminal domain-containing protein, partial [Nitrospinae bacterium]|nr:AsmA-like C-terminal domain-containing protein [Nitrospinota bacterium]